MEAVAAIESTDVMTILAPTREIFLPLLEARRAQIAKAPKKTFQYGPTERHQVDIYYPPGGTSDAPILFFVYGGAFVMGSRTLVPGLLFDNIGSFFAQRGILTAIADYRLAPDTKYPGPVEDIRDAIRFTVTSPDVDVSGHGADKNSIYVIGHSAGGTHAAALFLNEDILTSDSRSAFKGAVLMSGAYCSAPPFSTYYGEPASEHAPRTPLGLLESKSPEKAKEILPPKLLFLRSEKDPDVLTTWGEMFRKELREKGVTGYQEYTMKGHNHISPEVSLSSGEGEEWGEEVARWIKA